MAPAVNRIPGLSCLMPEGSFYAFVDARATGLTGYQLASRLLEEGGVVTVAGECFGKNGAGHIRLALTCPLEKLHMAAAGMEEVLKRIMNPGA